MFLLDILVCFMGGDDNTPCDFTHTDSAFFKFPSY